MEIIALPEGDAEEIGRILREQFGRRGGAGVVVTTDARTNSLIINGPKQQFAQVQALVDQLDRPRASDETIIRTYALEGAQADEAVRILSSTLQLDATGETEGVTIKLDEDSPAVEVKAQITADRRSNSVIVTATAESLPVIEQLIRQIDDVPAVSPVEYRIIPLEHAMADDVAFTLRLVGAWRDGPGPEPNFDYNRVENQLIVAATADQFEQIAKIVSELDQPSQRERITDFVPLEFAEAEKVAEALEVFYGAYALEADTPGKRNTRIVADPATNSLVITADEAEWDDIRALLGKLDSQEYDASLQLEVIPLVYADARSVARAINDAFQGRIERERRQDRPRERPRTGSGEDDRREPVTPSVLVESEEWVGASAEVQTNSVIVSANRQNIRKIRDIVERLDVADFARLPAPRLIPVGAGDPIQLARSLTQLYEQERGDRQGVRIVGDVASSTLVVRAGDEEFDQILALAEALQQEAASSGLTVRIIPLATAPALRVADAIRDAFTARADQANLPLSIQVDPAGNNLIVASTGGLIDEVEDTANQLDRLAPAAGQGIFIIELEHVSPDAAREVIETIGLNRPPSRDTTSRLVSEPIKVSMLQGRNAIIVIANPADRDTIIGLVKAIDVEPELADSEMRVVRLRNADADTVVRILQQVLRPADQHADTPLARAVQEQVRRLSVHREGLDEPDLRLDLTVPVRVIADRAMNAVVITSTGENLDALVELVAMFDALPIAGAVTVQLFPLESIAADQFLRITRDLFQQGKQIGQVPGSSVRGVPAGMVGKALFEEIALSADERTNTVIVAGSEDAVALVEVLKQRLDSEVAMGWVEPRLLRLRFADATDLADLLDAIIVRGMTEAPQASPLQQQVGRLRMARAAGEGRVLESEVFHPMSRLVIRPSEQLNALILIGTPVNLEIVGELVAMLDVEAASPDATVRIYPVENASAERLQTIITRLFDQQVRSKAIRPEDRVIVQADQRTNSLVVTTSPRSFAVLEGLLKSLDTEVAPDVREIRRIELANASADRLAVFIQELMDARLERLRTTQPETADLEQATILADSRTNSLVVVAGDESYAVIQQLAADLDESALSEMGLVEVLAVTQGNIDRIADAVDQIMDRRYADLPANIRNAQKPLVLTDPRTNSLLVAANQEDLVAIRDLLERLEAAPMHPAVGLHVIELPFSASAESLAPRLERLMRERQQSLGEGRRPSDRVSIEPDPVGNTIIVAASNENKEIVEQLLDLLMKAGSEMIAGRVFEVIPVTSSRASDIVELLDDLYVEEANRVRGPDAVRVTADERLNAVLVNADKQDVAAIRELVDELDGAQPAVVVEIKYIPLQSADAEETVQLVEDILRGRGIGARAGSEQAIVVKYLRELIADEDGVLPQGPDTELAEIEVSAAIREAIVLTPDLRTNTVIVSAPQPAMAMLEQMILDIDSTTTGSKNIAIFKLENADATAMAEILADLFNLRLGRDNLVLRPREDASPDAVGLEGTDLTAVPDQRQQLSITVDSRTNSLLVSGSPMYLDLVAEVVEELDAMEATERQTYVYKLMNAPALEVARVLGEFVREEQEKLVETLSPDQIGSAARLLEREITISGDEASNSVLISASPRYMDRVKAMVKELDVDPPQVLIQVMLAEVTLDATDDWGVDLDAMFSTGSAVISGGFSLATPLLGVPGVPNIQVAGTDFDMLIRAIQEQGRLAVLSNPSVMAANNQTARIQVGETIRVASTSNITESGNTNTGTEEKEVGIILEVTPSINPDGFVRLSVESEDSNLTNRTTQISENLEAPVITVRTANTTVTVRDGQTIVIGGLISDRFERRVRKVPFFGDIPLVGKLFRAESEVSQRTELMIVLTPHVIDSPSNAARVEEITNSEIGRLTLPERVLERLREGSFDLKGGLFDAAGNPVKIDLGSGGANDE
ncbi:MAG: secretin N-terminal domain-containing protein [Planctomycetota bacterium]